MRWGFGGRISADVFSLMHAGSSRPPLNSSTRIPSPDTRCQPANRSRKSILPHKREQSHLGIIERLLTSRRSFKTRIFLNPQLLAIQRGKTWLKNRNLWRQSKRASGGTSVTTGRQCLVLSGRQCLTALTPFSSRFSTTHNTLPYSITTPHRWPTLL